MIEYKNMRAELRLYLADTVKMFDALREPKIDSSPLQTAWSEQMVAINFILEDINVLSGKNDWIGVVFYDSNEMEAVRAVGQHLLEFYKIGQRGDYPRAFASAAWAMACEAAKSALALVDANNFKC